MLAVPFPLNGQNISTGCGCHVSRMRVLCCVVMCVCRVALCCVVLCCGVFMLCWAGQAWVGLGRVGLILGWQNMGEWLGWVGLGGWVGGWVLGLDQLGFPLHNLTCTECALRTPLKEFVFKKAFTAPQSYDQEHPRTRFGWKPAWSPPGTGRSSSELFPLGTARRT